MEHDSVQIRKAIEAKWRRHLGSSGDLFSADNISGTSPPSVFVGTFGYPKVMVGPMVPPVHGDTALFDLPEKWAGKSLDQIIHYRLNMVRGAQLELVEDPQGRYIEDLQHVTMASRPVDSDMQFTRTLSPTIHVDGQSAPFGPIGQIKSVKYSGASSESHIQKAYYDGDLAARDAVLLLYGSGVEVSRIQKCFSIGMLGQKRRLVPTKWSITAIDDMISDSLVRQILDFAVIDHYRVFEFSHLGNFFSVILFPHRWMYEMIEAWNVNGMAGFGSDHEGARGIDHSPAIAGAYFAAKLAVAEYLVKHKMQSGVLVLREIRPQYAVPVGVWQVREGMRQTMRQRHVIPATFDDSVRRACVQMNTTSRQWLERGHTTRLLRQKTLHDYV